LRIGKTQEIVDALKKSQSNLFTKIQDKLYARIKDLDSKDLLSISKADNSSFLTSNSSSEKKHQSTEEEMMVNMPSVHVRQHSTGKDIKMQNSLGVRQS